ncbi:LuxR C-terminal-related transcriptional regulator [Actinokineospora sp.]|uniref:LuxR C-terminal-related transcriptional regulator n=1 Tax=Actinokineospora sp. TaxID=1872133 RepID=UPI0040377944
MDLVRVWLVDDHELLTEALAARLSRLPDLWVLGRSTTDDPHLHTRLAMERPNVIVFEPESDRDLADALHAAVPAAHLVALTGSHDLIRAVAAARAGVAAWIPKESSTEHLVAVLRGVCLGHSWYPPEYLGPVLRGLREDARRSRLGQGPLDALSVREREVLACLVDGKRGAEIAAGLGLSANTVRTHTHSLYAKLGVHSRLAAVSLARDAGMATTGPDPVQTT